MNNEQDLLEGVCHFHSETGTEGGYWAFQENKFIEPPTHEFPNGHWSYEGLHILHDGDQFTIYSKDNSDEVVWSGSISLRQHPLFTEDAFGMWIHADQNGVERESWARWFLDEHPARLIPFETPKASS